MKPSKEIRNDEQDDFSMDLWIESYWNAMDLKSESKNDDDGGDE